MKKYLLICGIALVSTVTLISCKKDDTQKSESPTKVTDSDGNVYHTVTIGTQVWMVENLKTTKYRNGESIANVTDNTAWAKLLTGAWCDYENEATNSTKYGKLYNWYTVVDNRNLAPTGWHIPTNTEWTTLETYLISNGYNYDGSTYGDRISNNKIAKSLASNIDWFTSTNTGAVGNNPIGNNSSGFSALPGGIRSNWPGTFSTIGSNTEWWSSSAADADIAWVRGLYYSYGGTDWGYSTKRYGFSVRCIKDNQLIQ